MFKEVHERYTIPLEPLEVLVGEADCKEVPDRRYTTPSERFGMNGNPGLLVGTVPGSQKIMIGNTHPYHLGGQNYTEGQMMILGKRLKRIGDMSEDDFSKMCPEYRIAEVTKAELLHEMVHAGSSIKRDFSLQDAQEALEISLDGFIRTVCGVPIQVDFTNWETINRYLNEWGKECLENVRRRKAGEPVRPYDYLY